MDKRVCPFDEISLGRGEISLTGMKISPYKHSQVCWPVCWAERSKMQLQAIFNNCEKFKIVLESRMKLSHKHKTNLSRLLDNVVSNQCVNNVIFFY